MTSFALLVLVLSTAFHVEADDAPNVVSTQVLAAHNILFDTFPFTPNGIPQCFEDGGGGYEAGVLPSESIPLPLFLVDYFRIKEYDDNSTTMDRLTTSAGLLAGVGIFETTLVLDPRNCGNCCPSRRTLASTLALTNGVRRK